ncbi:MAG: ASKHA domain-containing protein [Opitutaceae bacterium]
MDVTVSLNSQTGSFSAPTSLFEAGESLGQPIPSSCRKQGKCRECLVEVVSGMDLLTPRTEPEAHLHQGFRLSCCARLAASEGEVRCHTLRRASMHVEDTALNLPPAARLEQPDPAVTRAGDRVLLDGREIDRSLGPLHGLAIDVGTTTVVVRVLDLETGRIVASVSCENPQRFGGSDVMSRIQYDTDHPGKHLQRTLIGYLSRAIRQLPVAPRSIYEIVVVGNSTMRDLFLGLDVRSIGQKPYWSGTEHAYRTGQRASTAVSCRARDLNLPVHPEARVYALPLVGGHVGGDAAACLLAVRPDLSEERVAIMDIGTNTELFMGNRDLLLAASCPAGPAFEGRAIRHGMPGLDGAIEKVALTDDTPPQLGVIGGMTPEGLCGSGLIDLLGELLRTGRMNPFGRFEDGSDSFTVHEETGIRLYESDINELAQAKGANVAGLLTVAKAYGLRLDQLDRFYLAGGFGRHLNIGPARRIGLIPNLPDEKIVQIGNAAIEGACIALLSVSRRRHLEDLVTRIRHVELETDPGFFDHFVQGCQFREVDTEEVGQT